MSTPLAEPYPYRWQLGLLLPGLPRRLIPGGFRNFPAGGADDALPEPVRQAHSCQRRRLPNQSIVLRQEADSQGGRVGAFGLFPRSYHRSQW